MKEVYELELRHRPTIDEPIDVRHAKFKQVLEQLEPPWGYRNECIPDAPQIGDNLTSVVELKNLSGRGRRSYIVYKLRSTEYLRDEAQYDDHVTIEFVADHADLSDFVDSIFPSLVEGFGSYRGSIKNRKIARRDWPSIVDLCQAEGRDVDGRDGVYRIYEINYFDDELCRRAFNLSSRDIVRRLDRKIERVSLLHDGVLLIYSSTLLPLGKLEHIDSEVRAFLHT